MCRVVETTVKTAQVELVQYNPIYNIHGNTVTRNCGRCDVPTRIPDLNRITVCIGFKKIEDVELIPDGNELVEVIQTRQIPKLTATDGCPDCYWLFVKEQAAAKDHYARTGENKAAFIFSMRLSQ